ncbi:ATP-grasp domain-containing protein [Streptomyces triticirhizae]|uniref:ATP-grasp domain-containing protein n=1 Tax=Streptomyces triticirhizae TaxID=2483353 RepID=A0A3M2LL10_9ACTN|nr:ATP-grasp domain-containing protein [Streptomyces triticirhizae]RMI36755.1 ATP-grasp domain-containing protein [Streptomyces triticirhizae]
MTIAALEALSFGLARIVEAAEAAGHRLALLTGDRAIYQHELAQLPADALDIVDVDTHDRDASRAALRALPDLAGLINSTDGWSVPAADLAAELGLPGPDPAAVRRLRDKLAVRRLLAERGLGPEGAIPVGPSTTAEEILAGVGLPAVLKDSAGTSSKNVWLARDRAELDAALERARGAALTGRLFAERYLAGPLYSAETLSFEGHTRLLGVFSRQTSPLPRVREEGAAFPVALPGEETETVRRWVGDVLAAAGHPTGFAHVEFVWTAKGPELVEINRRIGGALVGEALCRALGVNVYHALIDTTLGRRPALLDGPQPTGDASALVLIYPDRTGTLVGWSGLDSLAAFPGEPEWYPTAAPGDRVVHLDDQRGCTGILLTRGATAELAWHRALSAAGTIRAVVED